MRLVALPGILGLALGLAVATAAAQEAGDCVDPPMGMICDRASAARYLIHIAGELDGARDWCQALGADRVAWQVALDLWVRRNDQYLDEAARIASDGEVTDFTIDSPLIADHEPAIPVSERQCEHDLRYINEGRFDVDLEASLQGLKYYLNRPAQ